jgi:hypothetical protein
MAVMGKRTWYQLKNSRFEAGKDFTPCRKSKRVLE